MRKSQLIALLILFLLSCSSIPKQTSELEQQPKSNSFSFNIIDHYFYNACFLGEKKSVKVEIDFYNSKISSSGSSLLFPVYITNNSGEELQLDPLKVKLCITLVKYPYNSRQLQFIDMPERVQSGQTIMFAAGYVFRDENEKLGIEITRTFFNKYIDGLNSNDDSSSATKQNLAKTNNEIKKNLKTWEGKFEMQENKLEIPLKFKIIEPDKGSY